MATVQEQARINGALGGRPKGAKGVATLKREELRRQFEEFFGRKWTDLMIAQVKDSEKDYRPRQYVFDQMIGRPKESFELSGDENKPIVIELAEAIKKIYGDDESL